MKNKQFWLTVIVLITGIIAINWYLSEIKPASGSSGCMQLLPERFRSFAAAYLWEKADHLMHEGPVLKNQGFQAGSYAGNTDIVPLLKMIISLCPDQTAPYRLLATNYAYHLGMKNEALALLESAKLNCADSRNCHEIFATEAFIRLFTKNKTENRRQLLEEVISLLDEAIIKYKPDEQFPDPAFTLENYIDVKSSLQAKLSMTEIPADSETFSYNNENVEASSDIPQETEHHIHLKEESLLQSLIVLVIKAGLITGLGIIFYSSRFKIFWN